MKLFVPVRRTHKLNETEFAEAARPWKSCWASSASCTIHLINWGQESVVEEGCGYASTRLSRGQGSPRTYTVPK